MSERMRVAVLLALAMLVYANTLQNDFTMDDDLYILRNAQVKSLSIAGFLKPTSYNNVFRPLTFGSFAVNWALGGAHPFGYHLLDLLLHAAVTLLLYLVLQKLLENLPEGKSVAWIAALIFAVHPIHTEAVASIAGRSELLAAGFLLGAWFWHLCDRQALAVACFMMALLSKESAVAFVPLVLAGDYARGKLKPLYRYVVIAGSAVVYLALLWKAQGGRFGEKSINFLDNPLAHLPSGLRVLNAVRVAWKYFGLHVFPATLSCDYSYNSILLYANCRRMAPAGIAAILVIALWIWTFWAKQKEWFLAGAIYVGAFAATSNILLPTGTIMGERLAYVPSAGFCLLVALLLAKLASRWRGAAVALLVLIVAALGARTVARNSDWHDNLTLFSAGVRAVPGSAKMHCNLAIQYYYLDRLDDAGREAQIALQIYPDLPDAMAYRALVEASRGHDQEARRLLEKALALTTLDDPSYGFMNINLAAVLMKLGENEEALKLLDAEIARSPTSSRAWSNRAVIRFQRGEAGAARSDAEAALHFDPSNEQAQNLLRMLGPFAPQP